MGMFDAARADPLERAIAAVIDVQHNLVREFAVLTDALKAELQHLQAIPSGNQDADRGLWSHRIASVVAPNHQWRGRGSHQLGKIQSHRLPASAADNSRTRGVWTPMLPGSDRRKVDVCQFCNGPLPLAHQQVDAT